MSRLMHVDAPRGVAVGQLDVLNADDTVFERKCPLIALEGPKVLSFFRAVCQTVSSAAFRTTPKRPTVGWV